MKPNGAQVIPHDISSLPAWERGLKPGEGKEEHEQIIVAPCVGAWIETGIALKYKLQAIRVAPCVGAWIETSFLPQPVLCPSRRSLRGSVD